MLTRGLITSRLFGRTTYSLRLKTVARPPNTISCIKSLTKDDTQFLKDMHQAGIGILDRLNIPEHERRMGFHIPPYNSIDHLHLHVHALPYKSAFRALKYPVVKGWGPYHKGLSWFAEIRQSIAVLESGRRVGVLPC
ncbi:hypothetical protein CC1G_06241 [Coprinopsis cinerea okayama7|uniref:HIT domain-containing protein n=1 Tax=Coprinopsis cinerea (strain Okayama-7 / 130 / ATCC MYA-4618 / FGSC 9003) TaxID=240176 RepID=A8NVC4_COPC7|nr:hypothetical protein CC1G_06241 [Coprinopsis cinerea okayama7\|eukprot:XP_001836654.2 hypothetical protein CC1G_06241 [Coprinopsis cinerea okayama7\